MPDVVCDRSIHHEGQHPHPSLSLGERVRVMGFKRTKGDTEDRDWKIEDRHPLSSIFNPRTVILCLFLLTPSVTSAHAYLVKSVPAGRATLYTSPAKIQLWFNERLEPRYSSVSVHDPDGRRVDSDNAQVLSEDPKQLSIGVKQLPAGRYTVKFRVLSVDGHVVEQSFPFTIRETKQ